MRGVLLALIALQSYFALINVEGFVVIESLQLVGRIILLLRPCTFPGSCTVEGLL